MKKLGWILLGASAVIAGIAAAPDPSAVLGGQASGKELTYRILFESVLPPGYEAAVERAGGRVTGVSPELLAVEASANPEAGLPTALQRLPGILAVDLAGVSLPGCGSEAGQRATDPSIIDEEWTFQWDMQRYSSGVGGSEQQALQAAQSVAVAPASADLPFGMAGEVLRAVTNGAETIRVPSVCYLSGTADSLLYRRSLLYAAASGVGIMADGG